MNGKRHWHFLWAVCRKKDRKNAAGLLNYNCLQCKLVFLTIVFVFDLFQCSAAMTMVTGDLQANEVAVAYFAK